MNKDTLVKLISSDNEDDILLGLHLAYRQYNDEFLDYLPKCLLRKKESTIIPGINYYYFPIKVFFRLDGVKYKTHFNETTETDVPDSSLLYLGYKEIS